MRVLEITGHGSCEYLSSGHSHVTKKVNGHGDVPADVLISLRSHALSAEYILVYLDEKLLSVNTTVVHQDGFHQDASDKRL